MWDNMGLLRDAFGNPDVLKVTDQETYWRGQKSSSLLSVCSRCAAEVLMTGFAFRRVVEEKQQFVERFVRAVPAEVLMTRFA